MRSVTAPLVLVLLVAAGASFADAEQECSQNSFVAYGYRWYNLPVVRSATAATGDYERCAYGVPLDARATEEWYRHALVQNGWEIASRAEAGDGIVMEITGHGKSARIFVRRGQLATIVLLRRPSAAAGDEAPNKAMEPTR